MGAVDKLTTDSFDIAIAGDKPILVDFWAEWCGPCRLIGPIIEELAGEQDEVVFAKLNVDEEPSIAERYAIQAIPTMILFKNGEPATRIMGAKPKQALWEEIKAHA